MQNEGINRRGGWWVLGQNLLMLFALVVSPLLRAEWRGAVAFSAGVLLVAAGACLGIAGVRALGRNRTPNPMPLEDSRLVQHGVYRLVRHPLYGSLMCVSAGWALIWASWAGLALAGALALFLVAKAMREEHWLRQRYPEYRDYQRRTKRFIPGVW